ncbi:hypothetical protein [Thermodesulforhabdus norvegica]|nr:hypothetical protein [Thermodesulforhabdus norvegica]
MEDQRYRVSGVNRSFLQKSLIIGGIAALVGLLLFLAMPVKYYFLVKDGTLGLYSGRIGWLDGTKDKGFVPVFIGESKDEGLRVLLAEKFKSREEALDALRPVMLKIVVNHLSEIAELEQTLFGHYRVLYGEILAAHQAGATGLEKSLEALKLWLDMYAGRSQLIETCRASLETETTVKTGEPVTSEKPGEEAEAPEQAKGEEPEHQEQATAAHQ